MDSVGNLEQLLNDIQIIVEENNALYKNTGSQFNIFKITNMTYKEVHICQVIKELIDPLGSHHQGDVFFRLFVKHVLKIDDLLDESDYNKIFVTAEQIISNNRRIDIYIEIGDKFAIPIETKIYASDLDEQCSDYYCYASNRNKDNTILYYLTLDGKRPSANSVQNIDENNIRLISFEDEIITWLNACMSIDQIQNISPVREIISQFIDVLIEITGQKEANFGMEIKKLINNKEVFKSADILRQIVIDINNDLSCKVLMEIDNKITEKYELIRIKNMYDFEVVSNRSKGWQGCCYKLGSLNYKNFSVALRIAFETYLYVEICLLENDEIYWEEISGIVDVNRIVKGFKNNSKNSISWIDFVDDSTKRPNFQYYNDAYYELIEEDNFHKFIEIVMDDLDVFLSTLNDEYKPAIKK